LGICYAFLSEDIKVEMDCANSKTIEPFPN
jgi:hypothetical protein